MFYFLFHNQIPFDHKRINLNKTTVQLYVVLYENLSENNESSALIQK